MSTEKSSGTSGFELIGGTTVLGRRYFERKMSSISVVTVPWGKSTSFSVIFVLFVGAFGIDIFVIFFFAVIGRFEIFEAGIVVEIDWVFDICSFISENYFRKSEHCYRNIE